MAVKNQNSFLSNIGLNLGLRLPLIQTYIAENLFIILIFYSPILHKEYRKKEIRGRKFCFGV